MILKALMFFLEISMDGFHPSVNGDVLGNWVCSIGSDVIYPSRYISIDWCDGYSDLLQELYECEYYI